MSISCPSLPSRTQSATACAKFSRRCGVALLLVLAPADLASIGSANAVDAVTGASRRIEPPPALVLGPSGLADQVVLEKIINGGGVAHVLATINDDGSPHAEIIEPRYLADRLLRFSLGPGQTRHNIDRDGRAFLTVYPKTSCGDDPPSIGLRLVVARRHEDKPGQGRSETKGLRTLTLEIKTVLPLS